MIVENWLTERLVPYPQNARKIPPGAIAKVAQSITEFGWRQPIVVDRAGVVIVGHTRLLAAKKLGLAEVPVHVADLSPEQARLYRLMDNRSNEGTAWDNDILALEFGELKDYPDCGAEHGKCRARNPPVEKILRLLSRPR